MSIQKIRFSNFEALMQKFQKKAREKIDKINSILKKSETSIIKR